MAQEQQPLEILVIEDSDDIRIMYSRLLNLAGANVTTAEDGEPGIRMYEDRYSAGRPFDAVITDLFMLETDGIEVTQRIKQLNPEALVYLFTATQLTDVNLLVSQLPPERHLCTRIRRSRPLARHQRGTLPAHPEGRLHIRP